MRQRLDEDHAGELLTDCHSGIADLADEIVFARDQSDDLFLAEADFAEAVLHFRRGAKLLDAHRDARLNTVQRADVTFLRNTVGNRIHVHGEQLPSKPLFQPTTFCH